MATPIDFEALFRREDALLAQAEGARVQSDLPDFKTETPGPAGEPWIKYTPFDRVGLALSGGGIRSATFNLGVLKALHELDVLKHVDYLSTVSGGGYIGAWWSAWRARSGKLFPEALPDPNAGKNGKSEEKNREPEEVRHLREFSNFLSPRIGFFESEMWKAVIAVVSAGLPALLVSISVITLAFVVWLGLNSLILANALDLPVPGRDWLIAHGLSAFIAPLVVSIITIVTYISFEWTWHRSGKAEKPESTWGLIVFHAVMLALIVAGICVGWHCAFSFSPHLFDAPILWGGVALMLLVPRVLLMRFLTVSRSEAFVGALDRALSSLIRLSLASAAFAGLWLAGCWLKHKQLSIFSAGTATVISGGLIELFRKIFAGLGIAKRGGGFDTARRLISSSLPYVVIAVASVFVARFLADGTQSSITALAGALVLLVLFALVFFDPVRLSLHMFYRNRLVRAYLGASNSDAKEASENRQTDVRVDDDIQLRSLSPAGRERPVHLICCAANDLGGDPLGNLGRGSRSAILSKFGFAIGNYSQTWDHQGDRETLGLGSAITASAAPLVSNVEVLAGTLTLGLTFLISTLLLKRQSGAAKYLRLGIWLPHPLSGKQTIPRWLPGRLFFTEIFGATRIGTYRGRASVDYVQLCTGTHFENLGLYELVRRHCRYIIVSDCGVDPEVAFDDFGNAVRRAREDFGVEIDIDLSPLKPNAERVSKQHVAVGTISYDPMGDQKDNGILLYLKPTLTGDEPFDIIQYKGRSKAFPHEAIGDVFYDNFQWECYRRLGEHTTRSALRFMERERRSWHLSADEVFNGARWEWYQSPDGLNEKIADLTGRVTALEAELREKAPEKFIREMFPELETINRSSASTSAMTAKEISSVLHFLVQIIRLMEDVWLTCYLETHWNHPSNLGWMNTFQRWAYTPSFRLWWPILKPMYGSKFRRFMEERLSLADEDYPPTIATVTNRGRLPGKTIPSGVAQIYWKRMYKEDPTRAAGKTAYSFDLKLTLQRPQEKDTEYEIQAGLAFLDLSQKATARWTNEEFFVSPSLRGAGLGAKFLWKLLIELKREGFSRCEMTIKSPESTDKVGREWLKRTDLASRQQLNDLLAFYQRAGFILTADKTFVRSLGDVVLPEDAARTSGSDA